MITMNAIEKVKKINNYLSKIDWVEVCFSDINKIKVMFDFYESIIYNLKVNNGLDFQVSILYKWEEKFLSENKEIVINFKNCHYINISLEKVLKACKDDSIANPIIEIEELKMEDLNDGRINVIIINHYNDRMIDLLCDEVVLEYN